MEKKGQRGRPEFTDIQGRLGIISILASHYPRDISQMLIYDYIRNTLGIKDRKGIRRCLRCLKEDGIISEVKPYRWKLNDTPDAFAKIWSETSLYHDPLLRVSESEKKKSAALVAAMSISGRKYFRKMNNFLWRYSNKLGLPYKRFKSRWMPLPRPTTKRPPFRKMKHGGIELEILLALANRPEGVEQPKLYKIIEKKTGIRSDRWVREKLRSLEGKILQRISGKKEGRRTVWKIKDDYETCRRVRNKIFEQYYLKQGYFWAKEEFENSKYAIMMNTREYGALSQKIG